VATSSERIVSRTVLVVRQAQLVDRDRAVRIAELPVVLVRVDRDLFLGGFASLAGRPEVAPMSETFTKTKAAMTARMITGAASRRAPGSCGRGPAGPRLARAARAAVADDEDRSAPTTSTKIATEIARTSQ
jgi:hypothetical protein